MSTPDLHSKILNSASFHSLTSEQNVLTTLKSLDWRAIHSSFYTDVTTSKLREIDVLGKRAWERKLKTGKELADLYLIVEVKSAKGFHLLFSPLEGSTAYRQANEEWVGQDGKNQKLIIEAVSEAGLSVEQNSYISKKLSKMAYPRGIAKCYQMRVDPPPASVYVSAFRETNIGSEKELDSSVLWKASLSLASMVQSLKERIVNFVLESLRGDVEYALQTGGDPVKFVIDSLQGYVGMIELYHPVVVIDAPLWSVKKGELSEINWCRFQQLRSGGGSEWWFDVVHSSYFPQYAEELTKYYGTRFKKVRAKPYEFSRNIFTTYPHITEKK